MDVPSINQLTGYSVSSFTQRHVKIRNVWECEFWKEQGQFDWQPGGKRHRSNVTTEWLAFLLRIREVQGPNLSPETGYPDWRFSWFSSVHPAKCRDSTFKYVTAASFPIFSSSLFINHPIIRLYIVWGINGVVK
jgi:hypothetical protein